LDKHVATPVTDKKRTALIRVRRSRPIAVRRAPGRPREARIALAHDVRRSALGRESIRALKREGDGATTDRVNGEFGAWTHALVGAIENLADGETPKRADDGWCEDPADRNYNRLVKLPSRQSAEGLKRADHIYDLVLVLGFNDRPRGQRPRRWSVGGVHIVPGPLDHICGGYQRVNNL
jgi:L,D-peptidoglycan transpeptidase YkuD (ErfK/YbiS/YcfS/YnhG family)